MVGAKKQSKAGRKPLAPERIHIISIRLPETVKQALDKCAADDDRPNSAQLRVIITKYLRDAGYLK